MRYFIECAYLGKNYVGWQRQPNGLSVQESIEKALSLVLRSKVAIHGSSRTDTGVHAASQFAHFDSNKAIADTEDLVFKLNSFLTEDISVVKILPVGANAHARFDAVGRSYTYRINQQKNPFITDISYYFRVPLNIEWLNEAALILQQHTDFQCFSKVRTSVNNFNCDISHAHWQKTATGYEFHVSANRFLRGMVRAIVGTMIEVGTGKVSLAVFDRIILSRDRNQAGTNVAPHGLTLEKVHYPANYFPKND